MKFFPPVFEKLRQAGPRVLGGGVVHVDRENFRDGYIPRTLDRVITLVCEAD